MLIRCWLSFPIHNFIICVWNRLSVRRQWNKHGGCVVVELMGIIVVWLIDIVLFLQYCGMYCMGAACYVWIRLYSINVMLALLPSFLDLRQMFTSRQKFAYFLPLLGGPHFFSSLSFLLWALFLQLLVYRFTSLLLLVSRCDSFTRLDTFTL